MSAINTIDTSRYIEILSCPSLSAWVYFFSLVCHKMSYLSLTFSKGRAVVHLFECMLLRNTCIDKYDSHRYDSHRWLYAIIKK